MKAKEKIVIKNKEPIKREEKEDKVTSAAKEEEGLGSDSSLARQSFIRTRFKQSRRYRVFSYF